VNDVEAIEQVLAERALLDHLAQVAVRRRDDTDVDNASASVRTDLLELACLEESRAVTPACAASFPPTSSRKMVPM
jgi:hypothetical protein